MKALFQRKEASLILREKRESWLHMWSWGFHSPKPLSHQQNCLALGKAIQVQDKVHIYNTLNKVLQGLKYTLREFPWGLEVKKLSWNPGDVGLFPGKGTKIP